MRGMAFTPQIAAALDDVGPRVRAARLQRDVTLTALARETGISTSTLSRLEVGQRKPSLELLLPIAFALQLPLDELIAAPRIADPRVVREPRTVAGRTVLPLTRERSGPQAYKVTIPPGRDEPDLVTHDGFEWLYVLSGRLRLILGERSLFLDPGEAAEFDTRIPHWFGSLGGRVEVLSLFGAHGQRVHVRAKA